MANRQFFLLWFFMLVLASFMPPACSSDLTPTDGDSSTDGDTEADGDTPDPCDGAAVDCAPGSCEEREGKAVCVCPDGYHAKRYTCVKDSNPDGDLDSDEDGDVDSDEDFEWPEYANWPTPLPWYELEVKPYEPENPDPNCEEDAYYPGNSTKEGAALLESGARLENMSICNLGDEDWYRLNIQDDEALVIKQFGKVPINSTSTKLGVFSNQTASEDPYMYYDDWIKAIEILSNPGTLLLVDRSYTDVAQYYSFGVDFYKDVTMPSDPAYPTPLPSNHYLLTRHPRAARNEYYPPCLDIDAHHNENNAPGFGMIRLVYTSEADHTISMKLNPSSFVSLLADCRDPDSVIACLPGYGNGNFLIHTSDYAQRPACIAIGTLIYIEQTISMVRVLFVEESAK
jgi:hypothetical protein